MAIIFRVSRSYYTLLFEDILHITVLYQFLLDFDLLSDQDRNSFDASFATGLSEKQFLIYI